jgi:hypothetical protein
MSEDNQQPRSSGEHRDGLVVADGPSDDSAVGVIEAYPRELYDAAVEGRVPVDEFVDDLLRHAEAQVSSAVSSAAGAGS